MKTTVDERWGTHPNDVKYYNTEQLRKEFLVERLFGDNEINLVYTHNDRLVIGAAKPVSEILPLAAPTLFRSDYFCERREIGIICIENEGIVCVDGIDYTLAYKDALYIGRGSKEIFFKSKDTSLPVKFYFASAPAHNSFPTKAITKEFRLTHELGNKILANERTLIQLIINKITPCCQLQMGLTEIHEGSVWNTMPPHTHSRRMEAYFYFKVPVDQTVCHFMGQPQETRHIFLHNEQAIISPSWSIHSAAGTSNYSFIWAMCGENLDFDDMDTITSNKLK